MLATENMVTALGRIAVLLDKPALLSIWLTALPITYDDSEKSRNHLQLCSLVESATPHIMGQNYANLPKILSIFSWLVDDVNESDPKVVQRTLRLMTSMKHTLPQDLLSQVISACSQEDQHKLSLIFNGIP